MSEAEKIDVMRSNLLKILKNEINVFKWYEEQYFTQNQYKSAANPLDPKHEENFGIVEQATIERDIINKLNQVEEEIELPKLKNMPVVTTIDKYIITNQNN